MQATANPITCRACASPYLFPLLQHPDCLTHCQLTGVCPRNSFSCLSAPKSAQPTKAQSPTLMFTIKCVEASETAR